VVHLFDSIGVNESRFLKEARSIIENGIADEIILVCRWEEGLPREEFVTRAIRIIRIERAFGRRIRHPFVGVLRYLDLQRRFVKAVRLLQPEFVHCHSLVPLPAAVVSVFRTSAALVYDAHELETEVNGVGGLRKRFDRMVERLFIKRAHAVLCVSDAIASWYAVRYNITKPYVVRNIPDFQERQPPARSGRLRAALGLSEDKLVFLYQGGLFPGRRIEQFLRTFANVGVHRHLVCMGYGELQTQVALAAQEYTNIHLMPAVSPNEVLEFTADADVGLVGVQDLCLSYRLSLPNKLFEYVAAGVPVMMPAYPEMERTAKAMGCAIVVGEDDQAWRTAVERLTVEEIAVLRKHAEAARRHIGWRTEVPVLLAAYATAASRAMADSR
jgi:glycosyltransferase involved in cell wall biosynthesis